MEWTTQGYLLTDDPQRVDIDAVVSLLAGTYWAADRPASLTMEAVKNSVCFSLFYHGKQIGFARAITDRATFSYFCDVVVHPDYRGKGLGKWMVKCMIEHPEIKDTTQALRTQTAHWLYEPFGFKRTEYLRRSSKPS